MRWEGQEESSNVEDVRGRSPWVGRGAGLGCGGIVIVLVLSYLTGENPLTLLQELQSSEPAPSAPSGGTPPPPGDRLGKFASVILADTEKTWTAVFAERGGTYVPPKLVLFREQVPSACGMSSAAVGPFYCPQDRKVYLDLSFFSELSQRFGAPGEFAEAYVIAHEVGHHVQKLLGITDKVDEAERAARSKSEANRYSVAIELQADCLAGVWGFHAKRDRNLIEPGDFESGLAAAAAIGDDRLQKMATGRVQPEAFTHGSSAQRSASLRRGLEGGSLEACVSQR